MRAARRTLLQASVGAFLLALAAPFVARCLRPGAAAASVALELRRPAAFPAKPRETPELVAWPARYEAWDADALGLRGELLRAHNALELFLYRRAPNETLFLGEQGWIFLTGDRSREAWRGRLQLEPSVLEDWVRELRARESWFRERGIAFLHVCAPNKETIYPEFLPRSEERIGKTPLEQLLARFADEREPLPFLDLRAVLLEEKLRDRPELDDFVYHRHGSHWTARGAFAGVRAILERLAPRFPRLVPPRREDFELRELPDDPGDTWALALSLGGWLEQRVWDFAPRAPAARCTAHGPARRYSDPRASWENPSHPELPAMLLVSDSFGPWAHPLLAEHASRLEFTWKGSIPQQELVAAHPAIVIELYVERNLIYPPRALAAGLRLLAQGEFLGCEPLARVPQGRELLGSVEGWRGAAIRLEADGLHLRTEASKDKLLLPPLDPGPGRRLVLRLALRAPRDSVGLLWCQTEAAPQYEQRDRMAFDVAAGENELEFEIPLDGLRGRILLQPGLATGEYVLHGIEARSLPR